MRLTPRYILFFLFSLYALVSGAQNSDSRQSRERTVEYYYLHAISLSEQDSIDAAYEMLEHCYALDPSSLPVKYKLASYYQYMGKDSLAREMLESIVREEPSNMEYCDALVSYYDMHGDTESAIAVYEMVLRDSTHTVTPEVYKALYHLYVSMGEFCKALEMLDRVELLEGPSEGVSLLKVYQHVMLMDSVNALDGIRRMIAEYPDNQMYRNLLGETYQHFYDNQKAEEAYSMALQHDDGDVMAMSSLAGIYMQQGCDSLYCDMVERMLKSERIDAEKRIPLLYEYIAYKDGTDTLYMKEFFKELMKLPYDQVEIAETYAQYLIYRHESSDAVIPVVEKILALDPENTSALLQMLVYAIESNNYTEVVRWCDDALLYIPDMLTLYYYKGLAMYMLGDREAVIPIYEQGLSRVKEDDPTDVITQMYSLLGDLYHEAGNLDKCMAMYDSALVYTPEEITVLNNYAYYLALEGKELERALAMSAKTVEMEPDNAIYIDTYAWLLFCLERYEEAKAYAEKLLQANEDMSAVEYHHCGDIFAKCGEIDRAVDMWNKALELGDDSKKLKKKIKKRKYYPDGSKGHR